MNRPVSEVIREVRNRLTPSEHQVIEALIDDYPMPGLGSAAALASLAGVSVPTVVRLVSKLGFTSYPDFREQLKSELAERIYLPSGSYPDDTHRPANAFLAVAERSIAESLRRTFSGIRAEEFEGVIDLLADPSRRIFATGGWSSSVLAQHLTAYLKLLRPGVELIGTDVGQRAHGLLTIDEQSVVVMFDYRRYQPDTVAFGHSAKALGATLVLITDPILSPLAPEADWMLMTSVAGPPPFDGLSCGLAVVETLLSVLAERLGKKARVRLAEFEQILDVQS